MRMFVPPSATRVPLSERTRTPPPGGAHTPAARAAQPAVECLCHVLCPVHVVPYLDNDEDDMSTPSPPPSSAGGDDVEDVEGDDRGETTEATYVYHHPPLYQTVEDTTFIMCSCRLPASPAARMRASGLIAINEATCYDSCPVTGPAPGEGWYLVWKGVDAVLGGSYVYGVFGNAYVNL